MEDTQGLIIGTDGHARCWWCGHDDLYQHYHDHEWGRPVHDDRRLFEKICLEGFQSGLSWITILRKRENFRAAFADFDIARIATFTEKDIQRLLKNEGIIRHRGKIEATINNAARAQDLIAEQGSLHTYFWSFAPCIRHCEEAELTKQSRKGKAGLLRPNGLAMTRHTIPAQTAESQALSKDLKKRGWKFVGPTTCYAFMQAMGMVNDHVDGCAWREK